MNQDLEHLKLLSIFHYVVGGLAALLACFPILHLAMGVFFIVLSGGPDAKGDVPPAFVGWFLVGVASLIILTGWCVAICILLAGHFLAKRKHYTFCMVMAGIECLFFPFGTVLGVFSIVVLARESVKQIFVASQPTQPT